MKHLIACLILVSLILAPTSGCGVPKVSAERIEHDKKQEEVYYNALEEAYKKGIDPSTVPVPE